LHSRAQRTPEQYAVVEPGVKPLVDAMNATGVLRTIASCHGHAHDRTMPYVYFRAPFDVASNPERLIRNDNTRESPTLQALWVVEGRFNESFELCFSLSSPHLSRLINSSMWPLRCTRLRRGMRADLVALVGFVEQAVLTAHGQENHQQTVVGAENDLTDATVLRYPASRRAAASTRIETGARMSRIPTVASPWLGVVSTNLRSGIPRHADPTDGA